MGPPPASSRNATLVSGCVYRSGLSTRPSHLNPTMREIFWYFLKLGWLAFGGPVGQIGLMHLQVVERQKWIDEEEFVRALNFCHVLPGPEALQLAIYVGYKKGGYAGGALAGFLFILPGFITLTALAWIYVNFGKRPEVLGVLWGFRPVGLALLLAALVRISRATLKDTFSVVLALAAFVAFFFGHIPFLLVLLGSGFAYVGWWRFPPSFVLVLGAARHMEWLTYRPGVKEFLRGGTSGVVGLMFSISIPLAKVAFMPSGTVDWITVVLGLAAFAALAFWRWRLNVVVVVLGGGALGLLRAFAPALFGGPLS